MPRYQSSKSPAAKDSCRQDAPEADAPSVDDIKQALTELLESADFAASPRNRKFLAHIVERTLNGEKTSAYEVATKIFGRPETFDHLDPIVRIEASKLRRDLEVYYLKSGKDDRVRISLPKGRYRATFERNGHSGPTAGAKAVLRAALLGLAGRSAEAGKHWQDLQRQWPAFLINPDATLEALHGGDPTCAALLQEGLRQAADGSLARPDSETASLLAAL